MAEILTQDQIEYRRYHLLTASDQDWLYLLDSYEVLKAQLAEAQADVRALATLLTRSLDTCVSVSEDRVCGKPATHLARWSDRAMYVCANHQEFVQRCYTGDHDYDKAGGIYWISLGLNLEWAEALARPGVKRALEVGDGHSTG